VFLISINLLDSHKVLKNLYIAILKAESLDIQVFNICACVCVGVVRPPVCTAVAVTGLHSSLFPMWLNGKIRQTILARYKSLICITAL